MNKMRRRSKRKRDGIRWSRKTEERDTSRGKEEERREEVEGKEEEEKEKEDQKEEEE